MAVPDYESLMLPLLQTATAGEVRIADIMEPLAIQLGLSDEDRAERLPSGRDTKFSNRVRWAKTYLEGAGLLKATGRGRAMITDPGLALLADRPDRIDGRLLSRYPEFLSFKRGGKEAASQAEAGVSEASAARTEPAARPAPLTPDEMIRQAQRRLEAELSAELLLRVRQAPPAFFERLIVQLVVAMGYGGSAEKAGRAIGRSGDGGVDGVIDEDPLGLDRIYLQAKRYTTTNVGSPEVQGFFGALDQHGAHKGIFATTSGFTAQARATASALSKRIVLIDGELLASLMLHHGVGCRIEENVPIRRIDEELFTG